MSDYSKDELDNHSDQLNPNNDAYWQSRGFDERPDDWDDDWDDGWDGSCNSDGWDDGWWNCDYEPWCSDDFDDWL